MIPMDQNYLMKLLIVIDMALIQVTLGEQPGTSFCRDRSGVLPHLTYRHRTCTMCHFYLFGTEKSLVPTRDINSLVTTNSSFHPAGVVVFPDVRNATSLNFVCSTLTSDECERWTSCCGAASECCGMQTTIHTKPSHQCPRTWDGYHCWPDAQPGTTNTASCPYYITHSITTREAVKRCLPNGTWYKKDGHEWSDYTTCMDKQSYIRIVYIAVGCSVTSLLFLVPAIAIFTLFRELRGQLRIRLHMHFFLSLAISGVAAILWYLMVHYDMLATADSTDSVMYRNPAWCRVLSFVKIYLTSTNYFWMFCEGYFLHRLITNAFEPPETLLALYLFGWVVPLIPAICLAISKSVTEEDKCWTESHKHFQWIIYAPNFCCLVVNLVFLCNILRILLFQLHAHPHEPSSFRRGLKAAFMLIPLFGLQMFVTIYRPPPGAAGEREYEYITFFVVHSQGVFVSLIYCFFNGEVLNHTKKYIPCLTSPQSSRGAYVNANTTQLTAYDDRRNSDGSNNSLQTNGVGKQNEFEMSEIKVTRNMTFTNCAADEDLKSSVPEEISDDLNSVKRTGDYNGTSCAYRPIPTIVTDD